MAMIFLDTAKPEEVKRWAHLISGVTCNPLILSRERPGVDPWQVCDELRDAVTKCSAPRDLSFQVWTEVPEDAAEQAHKLVDLGCVVKLPLNVWGTLIADEIELREPTRPVNFTGIMSPGQVIVAAHMQAAYASLFWGRASDIGIEPADVCRNTQGIRDAFPTRLLVGSIRQVGDVVRAFAAGADVVTVQPEILERLVKHDRTESTIREFLDAYRKTNA